MSQILERVEDYFAMGVRAVWVVESLLRRAYSARAAGSLEVVTDQLTVQATAIRVPVHEILPNWMNSKVAPKRRPLYSSRLGRAIKSRIASRGLLF